MEKNKNEIWIKIRKLPFECGHVERVGLLANYLLRFIIESVRKIRYMLGDSLTMNY